MQPPRKNDSHNRQYLESLTDIRVVVPSSPGFGHQKATKSAMDSLDEQGFRGRYELLYHTSTGSRLTDLFEGFDASRRGVQKLGRVNFREVTPAGLELAAMELGLWIGRDDTSVPKAEGEDSPCQMFNVGAVLMAQPTDWVAPLRMVQLSDGTQIFGAITADSVLRSSVACTRPLAAVESVLNSGTSDGRFAILQQLLRAQEAGRLDLQVVYGLGNWASFSRPLESFSFGVSSSIGLNAKDELNALAQGLARAAPHLKKPLVVLILSDLNRLQCRLPGLPVVAGVDMVDQDALSEQTVESIPPGYVGFWDIGSLPVGLFDSLLAGTKFPPIVEGANSASLAKQTRGDWLLGGRRYLLPDPFEAKVTDMGNPSMQPYRAAYATWKRASDALNCYLFWGNRGDAVAHFYTEFVRGNLDAFFKRWREDFAQRPDAIEQGLAAIVAEQE